MVGVNGSWIVLRHFQVFSDWVLSLSWDTTELRAIKIEILTGILESELCGWKSCYKEQDFLVVVYPMYSLAGFLPSLFFPLIWITPRISLFRCWFRQEASHLNLKKVYSRGQNCLDWTSLEFSISQPNPCSNNHKKDIMCMS